MMGNMMPLVLMLAVNVTLVVLMVPRIYDDWIKVDYYYAHNDHERIRELLACQRQWIVRHCALAAAAVVMVALLMSRSGHAFRMLAEATAGYAVISLMLAFGESLVVQKIAAVRVKAERNNRR